MTSQTRKRVREVWIALLYGGTHAVRFFMALRLTFWAGFALLTTTNELDNSRIFHTLITVQPHWVWVSVCALLAVTHWWRIGGRDSVVWDVVTHSVTAGWWAMQVAASYITLGYLSPSSAPECVLVLISVWLTIRVEKPERDEACHDA